MTIETERLISPVGNTEDRVFEKSIRPQHLSDYIGQPRTREQMEIFIPAAKARGEALDHILIFGPPGLGKCITIDSYILTNSGWVQLADLIPKSLATDAYLEKRIPVYGLHGLEDTSHVYNSGVQDTVSLTTQAGFTLQGTLNHPIIVATPQGLQWKCLGDITVNDWVAIARDMQIWGPVPPLRAVPVSGMELRSIPETLCHQISFVTRGKIWQNAVELTLCSRPLITQIQLLLSNFGIIARRLLNSEPDQIYQLLITGKDVELFQQRIGLLANFDESALCYPLSSAPDESSTDRVPYAAQLLKTLIDPNAPLTFAVPVSGMEQSGIPETLSRQQIDNYLNLLEPWTRQRAERSVLEQLCNPKIYWDRVAKLDIGRAAVYDFCVPNSHSFVANGFYNHNTTLAHITANELGVNLRQTSGPILERPGDLAALLTNLEPRDVLFIDEIHRLSPVVEEILYPAMEDFQLDIMIGEGPAARSIKLDLQPFTLIGATTRAGLLTSPLRDRFGITHRLEFYNSEDLAKIIARAATIFGVSIDPAATIELARRARGTPRIANRLLRRVRDYAQVRADGHITLEIAQKALNLLNVDAYGLDMMDQKLLLAIMEKFEGGPVGVENLAAAIGEERGTIEEVIEPFLIQQGFIMRTPRGRVVTRLAWRHFGFKTKGGTDLFENE